MGPTLRVLIALTCLLVIAFIGEHFWREGSAIWASKRQLDAEAFLAIEVQKQRCGEARRALAMIQQNGVLGIPLDKAKQTVTSECRELP